MEWILKNDANSLGCAIAPAYYSARKDYKITREFPAGYGFADVVFLAAATYREAGNGDRIKIQ